MAVVFEVSGSLAMFRRPYTTTSSVSFPIAPPTAVAGLIGAILGFENGSDEDATNAEYWAHFKGTQFALEVLSPISWYSGSVNFWNTKMPQKSPHIQVKHQFLKNPKYRIHVIGPLEESLKSKLESNTFYYTPCLGTAYAFADLKYIGQYPKKPITGNISEIPISSVIPYFPKEKGQKNDSLKGFEIDIKKLTGMFIERLPFQLDTKRSLQRAITVLYGKEPNSYIYLKNWESLEVSSYEGLYISWFPSW